MAKIDSRCSAPPENILAMPRMPPELSWKKRLTAAGLMPGQGMKVPMRYTTMPAIRKNRRPRISEKREASPSAFTGLLSVLLATVLVPLLGLQFGDLGDLLERLDRAAGGRNSRQRTL